MAAPKYIDSAYVGNAIGESRRDALVPNAAALDQLIESATAKVRAAILYSGYSPPSEAVLATLDNTGPLLKTATLGAMIPVAYGRQGQEVPTQFYVEVNTFNALAAGNLPLEDLEAAAQSGHGGSGIKTANTIESKPAAIFADLRNHW